MSLCQIVARTANIYVLHLFSCHLFSDPRRSCALSALQLQHVHVVACIQPLPGTKPKLHKTSRSVNGGSSPDWDGSVRDRVVLPLRWADKALVLQLKSHEALLGTATVKLRR
jgi:hypothetical protein